jgi:molybdenum cofactor cytidylyltransferase
VPNYNAVGIILAAGESSRMGSPKGLLEWRGTTLLEYQMNSLLQGGCDKVVVVTGKYDAEMAPLLKDRPGIIRSYNPKYLEGKTSSIKAGVWELPDDIHSIVLLAVDQPRPAWVIEKVLRLHIDFGADVTSPGFDGHGGHPLVFDAKFRSDLLNITEEDKGVRAIFRKSDIDHHQVKFDSAIVRLDINTPEAYENALAAYTELAKSKL